MSRRLALLSSAVASLLLLLLLLVPTGPTPDATAPGASRPTASTSRSDPVATSTADHRTSQDTRSAQCEASHRTPPAALHALAALPARKEALAVARDRFPGASVVNSSRRLDDGLLRETVVLADPGLPRPVRVVLVDRGEGPRVVEESIANRLLLRGVTRGDPEAEAFARTHGLQVQRRLLGGRLLVLAWQGTDPDAADHLKAAAAALRAPLEAQPDTIVRAAITPDDPRYLDGSLWGLHNTGQEGGTADADIDAPEGWDLRREARDVIVAVIDSGVLLEHEDLAPNLWTNPGEIAGDGIDNDGNGWVDDVHGIDAVNDDGDPSDDHGHGTHVSGTVAGRGNNGLGVVGVAWEARLMGLKFLGARGTGSLADAITCIDYALSHGATILNNSWGSTSLNESLLDAIVAAREAGALFVAAAGNRSADNDLSPYYPASFPVENVIAVAATNRDDLLASFSSRGLGSVLLAAPGDRILSARHSDPRGYVTFNGTSMATPAVSGTLALLRAQSPSEPWWALRHRLLRGVDPIPALATQVSSGGRLNLRGALAASKSTPPNDDLDEAWTLTGSTVSAMSTNLGATREAGEPAHAGIATADTSLWYRWRAPVSGRVFLDSQGSTFDTVIAVYRRAADGAMTLVASNDDGPEAGEIGTSALSFLAEGGELLYVAIAGKAGTTGVTRLNLAGPPPNDDLAAATPVPSLPVSGTGSTLYASKEPGEPDHAGEPGGASIWARWTPEESGRVLVSTGGSSIDTVLAVYRGPAEGATFASLALVGANDDYLPGETDASLVRLDAEAGATYYLATDGKGGAQGPVALRILPELPNDSFAGRAPLVGVPAFAETQLQDATREEGEPDHGGSGGNTSVWYTWTAPATDDYRFDTAGSLGPTVLALYEGDSLSSLVPVASDTLSGPDASSRILRRITAGTVLAIAIDNPSYTFGVVSLTIDRVVFPTNDAFASAAVLEGLPATGAPLRASADSSGATSEPGEPGTGDGATLTSLWWRWTAPASGRFTLSTEGSDFDTLLDVFTGTALDRLVQVATDDDSGPVRTSRLAFDAQAGTTYSIRVHGYLQRTGSIQLSLEPWQAVANDAFASPTPLVGDVLRLRQFTSEATAEPDEPAHAVPTLPPARSVWFVHDALVDGPVTLSTDGSSFRTRLAVYTGDSLATLVAVASNDDHHLYTPLAQLTFQATAGTRYRIAVDADDGDGGALVLTQAIGPANDLFAARQDLGDPSSTTVRALNFGATRETGEPRPANVATDKSLWWSWVAPETRQYEVTTEGSTKVLTLGGVLPMDTVLAVYTGDTLGGLTSVVANDNLYTATTLTSRVTLNATAGTRYAIAVAGRDVSEGETPARADQGEIVLTIRPFQRATNDAFAAALPVGALPAVFSANNLGCGIETGEPGTANNPTPNTDSTRSRGTLWWRWTADRSGRVMVATNNLYRAVPSENTIVSVYRGAPDATFATLQLVAWDATGNGSDCSAASFVAESGETYWFQVGGASRGDFSLLVARPPANDDFARAELRSGSSWTASGHNLAATFEQGEPRIDAPSSGRYLGDPTLARSIWWRWTAPASGSVTVDTLGSGIFSLLAVYRGDRLDALERVAVQDSSLRDPYNLPQPRRGNARVVFTAVAGMTYSIQVEGGFFAAGSVGLVQVQLQQSAPAESPGFVTIHAANPSAVEGGVFGSFALLRTGELAEPLDVGLAVGGTAIDGVDLEPLPRTVRLPAGLARIEIPVVALEDGLLESRAPERVQLSVEPRASYRLGAASSAMVDVIDPVPFTSASPTAVVTGPGSGAVHLRWSFPPADHVGWRIQLGGAGDPDLRLSADFDDAEAGPLVGSGPWVQLNAGSAAPTLVAGSLVAGPGEGTEGLRVVTRAAGISSTQDARATFANPSSSPAIFASMVVRLDDVSGLSTSWQLVAQLSAGGTNGPALFIRRNGLSAYDLGVHKRSNGSSVETAQPLQGLASGVTRRIVLRYAAVEGGTTDDGAALWVDPAPATLGASAAPAPTFTGFAGNDASTPWTAFSLLPPAQVESAFDRIRVGATWASVTRPAWPGESVVNDPAPEAVIGSLAAGSAYRVRIRAEGPTGVASAWSIPVGFTTGTSPSLADWQSEQFPNDVPAAARGPSADPDGDSLANLLEYAFGNSPTSWSPSPALAPGSGSGAPSLTFLRARADMRYRIESSTDLRSWNLVVENPGTSGESVTVPLPAEGPNRSYRVVVESAP